MAERRAFKPADGVEARAFEKAWCECCSRHAESGCWVLLAASIYEAEDADYPEAWIVGDEGPECTAMEPALRAVGFDRPAFEVLPLARGDGR